MTFKPLLATAAVLMAGAAHGAVLASIPYDFSGPPAGQLSFSYSGDSTIYRWGYEPFTLANAASLTSLDFVGVLATGDISWPPVASFQVVFTADSAALPGLPVATPAVSGDGNPTAAETLYGYGLQNYTYTLGLGDTQLPAGNYWVSIRANLDSLYDGWYWGQDLTGSGPGLGQSTTGSGFTASNIDYSFTLNGFNAVPKPAGWILMLLGVAALGGGLRRRRQPVVSA